METDVTDVAVTESLQVAAAGAGHIDEDATVGEQLYCVSLGTMIYNYLTRTVDIKHSNLIDKLAAKDILLSAEKQKIKEKKKNDAKVNSLLVMLREKSAAEFESFLTTLNETGQQSVASVVRLAFHSIGQTGHNPLHIFDGKIAIII